MTSCAGIGGFFLVPASIITGNAIFKNRIDTVFSADMSENLLDGEYTIGTARDTDLILSDGHSKPYQAPSPELDPSGL